MKDFFSFCKKFKRNKTRKMDNLNKVLNTTRPVVSGLLHKYTNVVKGFQLRYCKVDAENGILSYYLCENNEEIGNSPRGVVKLIGALINPSDEDSRTFTINSSAGDIIKLKANDAKARQEWVDALRAVVENLSSQSRSTKEHLATYDCFIASRKQLQETESCNAELSRMIESCDFHTDKDFLLMKALSAATTSTLSQALVYLQKYNDSARNELY
ncbi:oxysterol-binding protein-related protein 11 [Chironomus tepperi]|uniref:oxysterol-binding protein-related protein 11 n=1 Tax=Chironomus tepperi TaxID=113505 RepID=UPI00391EE7EC